MTHLPEKTAEELFGKSQWIWPVSHNWDLHNSYALFRKEFDLPKVPTKAPLLITADQSYQLYLNGHYVCRGPARGFQAHWPYDEVDVSRFLRPGRNLLAVRAHNPGFSNFQYLTQGYAGLLVAAKWGATRIVTDGTWKSRRQTGLNRDTVPTSFQLFCQEHIDLRLEDPEWMQPDFDDAAWATNNQKSVWNGMPWPSLEPRGIPMLEERMEEGGALIGTASGSCAEGYALTRDITRLRHSEGLAHEPWKKTAGEIRVATTGRGKFRSFLIDFGHTVVGSVGFEISGAGGGEILDTLHAETIDPATQTPVFVPDVGCHMAFGHRLICRAGDQTHTFYHTFGFRYMVLTVRDSKSPLKIRPFLRTTLYPLEQQGNFQSSDAALQRIWETCAWTQRVCSMDAYVDTPWREQTQWWGDARVQAMNTFFYSGDTRLFRRGIAQLAGQTLSNGLTYGHAPTMAHGGILPDFTLIWVITLWDYYWQTGSLEAFLNHQETIQGVLNYFSEKTDPKTGLVGYDNRYWLFLDWTGLFKDGYSTVYNLWLLIALERLILMYRKAAKPDEAKKLAAWAARLRKALGAFVLKNGLLCDGLTFAGKRVQETSIHSQTLAILAGFHPERNAERINRVLLPFIRGEAKPAITPSSYWITYVFEVLIEAGHGADVLRFIREKWTPMAEHGTTWETFKPSLGMESFSHAWSAHPLYHLMRILGGIRQRAAEWTEITYEPVFEGDFNETVVPTPHGKIISSWKREGDQIKVSLTLPKGVSASVRLSGKKPTTAQGESSWSLKA